LLYKILEQVYLYALIYFVKFVKSLFFKNYLI